MSTILVVDDTQADRHLLRALLQPQGYTVLEAPNVTEALQVVGRQRPNLVIVDIFMPHMDGLQLAAHLRADPVLATLPVMFCTAWYDDEDTRKAMRAFGYPVLAKPLDLREVLAHIDAMLQAGAGHVEP